LTALKAVDATNTAEELLATSEVEQPAHQAYAKLKLAKEEEVVSHRFIVFLIASTLFTGPTVSKAQDCQCKGQRIENFTGGNGRPLSWFYQVWVVKKTSAQSPNTVTCYLKRVENKSADEVRDVRWLAAAYVQTIIPPNSGISSCPQVAGEIRLNPEIGPLHYGPSSQFYETTVRVPEKGWPSPITTVENEKTELDDLRSDFAFYVPDPSGKPALSRVSVTSSVVRDAKGAKLTYAIENGGDGPVSVLLNPPATEQLVKDAVFIQRPSTIKPGDKLVASSFTVDKLQSTAATIVFFDTKGNQVALEAAGVYAPATATPFYSDAKFWPAPDGK
jgi:hypothetical protein